MSRATHVGETLRSKSGLTSPRGAKAPPGRMADCLLVLVEAKHGVDAKGVLICFDVKMRMAFNLRNTLE